MNDYEREHNAVLRRSGAECAVLLKTDGRFPLDKPCKIALYGSGARCTVKGGTGSGEVNSRTFVTAEEGLKEAGFTITTGFWLENYEAVQQAAKQDFIRELQRKARKNHTLVVLSGLGAVMPEPEYSIPLTGAGETAVYVLSRISGEGNDRRAVPGDILLTATEQRDILLLNSKYKNFMLVLNVGGVVDLSPVREVGNILLLSQLGTETGNILADILLGRSYPSGKLTTTWSAWEDYAGPGTFGEKDDTRYREGVYVGYRFFDTVGKKPFFPFGFGLCYTSFEIREKETLVEGETVTVRAEVVNTGRRPGKETVQLYVSAPDGRLDKPFQSLAAFSKTRELDPGERSVVELSFRMRELASYDESTASWLLEPGDYILRLGSSSADTEAVAALRLDKETVTRRVRNCCGRPDFEDWRPETPAAETECPLKVIPVCGEDIAAETVEYDTAQEIDPAVAGLTDEELIFLNIGSFDPKAGSLSVVGNASKSVAGAAGETTGILKEKGIPPVVMADGPAGVRISRQYTVDEKGIHSIGGMLPESVLEMLPALEAWLLRRIGGSGKLKGEIHEQYCTAIPIGTALAQSWNTEFAEMCGDIVGDEMERFGVHLWLAPALNIHRDIRCGRNFEYFSEDPLISGKFAAALTKGVQKHPGRGTTLKHFAANNQETNRYNSNSQVSERAMREIYLRGFEIAVKESQPHALMTSYNLLNGTHTSERRDLIMDVLRSEFGFRGVVMTDWIIGMMSAKGCKYPAPDAAKIAAAGNDLVMPGSKSDFEAMLRGLKGGILSRRQLAINAGRVRKLALESTSPPPGDSKR